MAKTCPRTSIHFGGIDPSVPSDGDRLRDDTKTFENDELSGDECRGDEIFNKHQRQQVAYVSDFPWKCAPGGTPGDFPHMVMERRSEKAFR